MYWSQVRVLAGPPKTMIKNFLHKILRKHYEKTRLFLVKKHTFLIDNLSDQIDFISKLNDKEINNDFNEAKKKINKLGIPNLTGGVSPIDQELIFKIIRAIKPRKILEIGTHIGSSTVSIALALALQKEEGFIKTVDIQDVNDEKNKPWLKFDSKNSPKENLKSLQLLDHVNFEKNSSLDFFNKNSENFDLVFLDGSHRADDVYKEISLALDSLKPSGFILLHDYYPNSKPVPGPNEAVKRIQKENKLINIYHFSELLYFNSSEKYETCLAILYKK